MSKHTIYTNGAVLTEDEIRALCSNANLTDFNLRWLCSKLCGPNNLKCFDQDEDGLLNCYTLSNDHFYAGH